MNDPAASVTVDLRIPGQWSHPQELIERLPAGYRLMPDALTLPDGTQIDFGAAAADGEFARIFRSSCREDPTDEELATVDGYTVNAFLSGPGGSMQAARIMMRAASAIVRAGGAGVFIDNSAIAHGGRHWLDMTEDGGPDAVSFAFVSIIRGKADVWTMGMHVLGFRDLVMKAADVDAEDVGIIDMIRYVAQGEKPIGHGHVIADLKGLRYRVVNEDSPAKLARGPMHNPFGRFRLVSMRDIAETN
jgi:hypothetical protein